MVGQSGQKPFSWHVSRIVKPRLTEMGFRLNGSSRALFDRPLERGLVEYVLWVCHRYRDALHVQWGVRHACSSSLYTGWSDQYNREDYVGESPFGTEAELTVALGNAFQTWLMGRRLRLSRMQRSLRRNKKAKADLLRWHAFWKEYTASRLINATRIQMHFASLPQEIVQGAWKFVERVRRAPGGNRLLRPWEYFVMLKEYQARPSVFKGDWWELYGYAHWPANFFAHLDDLDALLEPYDC